MVLILALFPASVALVRLGSQFRASKTVRGRQYGICERLMLGKTPALSHYNLNTVQKTFRNNSALQTRSPEVLTAICHK